MKWIIPVCALLGLSSVITGAAGDHIFGGTLSDQAQRRFDTALHYHQIYGILLLALGMHGLHTQDRLYRLTTVIFMIGIIVFCGALYLSILPSLALLVYATPIGGILLMLGWAGLFFWGLRLAFRVH